jgi:hypothetical protein
MLLNPYMKHYKSFFSDQTGRWRPAAALIPETSHRSCEVSYAMALIGSIGES